MIIEQRHETARLTALADALENARVLAGWAEIRAEASRRERMQIDRVRPKITEAAATLP